MRHLVGPSGTVHAFEPTPPTLRVLRHTVKTLRLNNVTVHPFACGEQNGFTTFSIPIEYGIPELGGARCGSNGHTHQWKVVKLDDMITPAVAFIKIDAEGGELFVLCGAERILRESRPVILFEAAAHTQRFDYQQQDVFDFPKTLGYDFFSGGFRGRPFLEPRSCFGDLEDYFAIPSPLS